MKTHGKMFLNIFEWTGLEDPLDIFDGGMDTKIRGPEDEDTLDIFDGGMDVILTAPSRKSAFELQVTVDNIVSPGPVSSYLIHFVYIYITSDNN